jgi:hypothetical protein
MSRADDMKIAEKIFGWLRDDRGLYMPREGKCSTRTVPNFTTDVTSDLKILHRVRSHWNPADRAMMVIEFIKILQGRDHAAGEGWIMQYQPGDYSRAALRAIEQGQH